MIVVLSCIGSLADEHHLLMSRACRWKYNLKLYCFFAITIL